MYLAIENHIFVLCIVFSNIILGVDCLHGVVANRDEKSPKCDRVSVSGLGGDLYGPVLGKSPARHPHEAY